jgi:hypothetical protein
MSDLSRTVTALEARLARLEQELRRRPVIPAMAKYNRRELIRIGNGNLLSNSPVTVYGVRGDLVTTVPTANPNSWTSTDGGCPNGVTKATINNQTVWFATQCTDIYGTTHAVLGNIWIPQSTWLMTAGAVQLATADSSGNTTVWVPISL